MSDVVIRAEGLGKAYQIRHEAERGHDRFSEMLTERARRLFRRRGEADPTRETFWALRDVSFEVREGEVVGIIGRNGAGKTTLLKILSRITEPTEGRAEIRGRVASLLEVGTGFHPELTGRENVFLNGAILGMSRAEIRRKFDEIVDFAGVEKFLDTPVKRYSSGMRVRLAFAVAAHLEPEILIVDEVLAVGDAEFQKRCLGKMGEVARQGRTVLFVSHNLNLIAQLCQCAILMNKGILYFDGGTDECIQRYLDTLTANGQKNAYRREDDEVGPLPTVVRAIVSSPSGKRHDFFPIGAPIRIELCCRIPCDFRSIRVGIGIDNAHGVRVTTLLHSISGHTLENSLAEGIVVASCMLRETPLAPGNYRVKIVLSEPRTGTVFEAVHNAFEFEVADVSQPGYPRELGAGSVCLKQEWQVSSADKDLGVVSLET